MVLGDRGMLSTLHYGGEPLQKVRRQGPWDDKGAAARPRGRLGRGAQSPSGGRRSVSGRAGRVRAPRQKVVQERRPNAGLHPDISGVEDCGGGGGGRRGSSPRSR